MTAPLRPATLAGAEPLPRGPGIRTPQTRAALAKRDALICEAAAKFCVGLSSLAASEKLHDALCRYRQAGWRRECAAMACPPRHAGKINAWCWLALKARDAVPSARTIRAAIDNHKRSYSLPTDPARLRP